MSAQSLAKPMAAAFGLCLLVLVAATALRAQTTEGKWVLGLHGGGNIWVNDYSTKQLGPGGDFMLRYGISPGLSAGFVVGYEELKSQQEPPVVGMEDYLKLHAIPAAATIWVHFAPGQTVSPYGYVGLGAMLYKRLNGASTYIPDSKYISTVLVPFGLGLEAFASENVSIAFDIGYRVTDDHVDNLKLGKLDGFATAKAGINLYFGTSGPTAEELEAERLRAEEAERARAKAEADADALRLKQQADADAAALEAKRKADADAAALRAQQQSGADAEARRVKELADAEARRLKDLADAEARRLAEQQRRDTTIILEKGKTVVLKGVNFEFNKATLTPESETILERALRALRDSPDLNVLIVGHTDNIGTAAYNKKLSFRRAETVKSWLVRNGISAKRLSVAGKGFDEPIDVNTTDEGRANNRRIEFKVLE